MRKRHPYFQLGLAVGFSLLLAACNTSQARVEKSAKALTPTKSSLTWEDEDTDGLPDAIELHSQNDRANFRRWFTHLSELQFYRLNEQWNPEQRDCAGLVRFAWREALRKHDRLWFQSLGEGVEPVAPDIKAYTLDRSPVGEKLFRTDFGSFVEADLTNGKFSDFADARTLKNYNSFFVSRDWRQAQPGDLLFVAADRPHRFEDFTEDFAVWVMFYGPEGGEGA